MRYLLFGGYKDKQGGAEDFHSAHTTIERAKAEGIEYWSDGDARLGSWMHLALLNEQGLKIIARLNIPGTEGAEDDELSWRDPYQ